jgi:flagellar biosynthesis component FlhA
MVKKTSSKKITNKGSQNYFYAAFTGTLGVMTGMVVYGIYVLAIVALLSLGIYFVVTAKKCKNEDTGETETVTHRDGSTTQRNKKKMKCKSFSELEGNEKIKFIIGCILIVIFGILVLVEVIPYVLAGFGHFMGIFLGRTLVDQF